MDLNIHKITSQLFGELEERGFSYCIYNGYENLPEEVKNDLDIAIEPSALKHLDEILLNISRENNAYLLHKIWHDAGKVAYIISPRELTHPERLQLDFFSEFSIKDRLRRGPFNRYLLMKGEELLKKRIKKDYYYIPSTDMEFIMKLLRRIFKGDFDRDRFSRIRELFIRDREASQEILRKYFSENYREISRALENDDLQWFLENEKTLRKELKRFRRHYFTLGRVLLSIKRFLYRIKHPVGMTVALLGPDGSGKTTLAKETMRLLSRSFHGQKLFYWRPGLLKQPGVAFRLREEINLGTNPDPHGHEPEHPLKSLFRFLYYLIDFTLGYWLKVWPLKVRKHLCVFDRYYYDVLVDPFRYNFSLPEWLLKFCSYLVPRPDLVAVLDSPLELLYERKKELGKEELQRQKREFISLTQKIKNAWLIETSKGVKETAIQIANLILREKSMKTLKVLKIR